MCFVVGVWRLNSKHVNSMLHVDVDDVDDVDDANDANDANDADDVNDVDAIDAIDALTMPEQHIQAALN